VVINDINVPDMEGFKAKTWLSDFLLKSKENGSRISKLRKLHVAQRSIRQMRKVQEINQADLSASQVATRDHSRNFLGAAFARAACAHVLELRRMLSMANHLAWGQDGAFPQTCCDRAPPGDSYAVAFVGSCSGQAARWRSCGVSNGSGNLGNKVLVGSAVWSKVYTISLRYIVKRKK
jgi:hypothetical protein